jgi:hypothetical protein
MKFKFIAEHESIPFMCEISSKRKVEFSADSLDDILVEFEMFLKGCGYCFDGHLDFVQVENFETDEDDLDDVDQWFSKARETAKKLDEVAIMKADISQKTPDPWPFTTGSDIKIEIVDSPRDE